MDWTIEFDKAIEQYLPDLEVLQDRKEQNKCRIKMNGSGSLENRSRSL